MDSYRSGILASSAAAVLLCALLVAPPAVAVNVEYCDKGVDYPVKVNGINISPSPVARGEPAKFIVSATSTSGSKITKGKVVIDVHYFGFNVHQEIHDLCEETSCPVSGDFVLAHEQTLPIFTPPGSYTITMNMAREDGKQLTCFTFGFDIGFIADN